MATASTTSVSCNNPRDLSIVPRIDFSLVESYTKAISKASGKSHIDKGFKYFHEAYVHNIAGNYDSFISHTKTSTVFTKCIYGMCTHNVSIPCPQFVIFPWDLQW